MASWDVTKIPYLNRSITDRTRPNNGMHPTRDTTAFIYLRLAGGRVMPGVMRLPPD